MDKINDKLISTKDAQAILGVSSAQISRLIKAGVLAGKSFGTHQKRCRYILRASLERFMGE